jgi:hypothetical protein
LTGEALILGCPERLKPIEVTTKLVMFDLGREPYAVPGLDITPFDSSVYLYVEAADATPLPKAVNGGP